MWLALLFVLCLEGVLCSTTCDEGSMVSTSLTFGSCNSGCSVAGKPAEIKKSDIFASRDAASSQEGSREAELIWDFTLGSDTKIQSEATPRSKRYFWMKLPITIEPTGEKVKFQVEGLDTGSLKERPYTGMADCSDGIQRSGDPAHGVFNALYTPYNCLRFNQSERTGTPNAPLFWKLLMIMDPNDYNGTYIEETNRKIRIRLTDLRYARKGVSIYNSAKILQYFVLVDECGDRAVKKVSGRNSSNEADWWIQFDTFDRREGVGSVFPSSVDYWQMQPTKAGPLVQRKRVLDYSGTFGVTDVLRTWKKERAHSDVQIKFSVNNIWRVGDSVNFELGDATQSVKCKEGAAVTQDNWRITWNGRTATVQRVVNDVVLGDGPIQEGPAVVIVMSASDFQCYLPENGLNPIDGDGPLGPVAALSLSLFRVTFRTNIVNDGRALQGIIDVRHPVYKYQCLTQTLKVSSADYCTGNYPIRMCAVSDASVSAFLKSKNLGSAKGFPRLVNGSPGGVPVYNLNVTVPMQTGATNTEIMKKRCDALHSTACRFNEDPAALVGAYSTATTRLDLLDEKAIQAICCSHSPETHEKDVFGIGNLATCMRNSDCDDIPAGVDSVVSANILVAKAEDVCCDYCYKFYGSVACVDAQGFRPDLVAGTGTSDANPGTYQPFIVHYCNNIVKCTDRTPCKGYTFGGKGTTIPATMDAAITIQTLSGDGVSVCFHLSKSSCLWLL